MLSGRYHVFQGIAAFRKQLPMRYGFNLVRQCPTKMMACSRPQEVGEAISTASFADAEQTSQMTHSALFGGSSSFRQVLRIWRVCNLPCKAWCLLDARVRRGLHISGPCDLVGVSACCGGNSSAPIPAMSLSTTMQASIRVGNCHVRDSLMCLCLGARYEARR